MTKKGKKVYSKRLAIGRVSFDGLAKVTIGLTQPCKGAVQVTVHGGVAASNGATSSGDVSRVVP